MILYWAHLVSIPSECMLNQQHQLVFFCGFGDVDFPDLGQSTSESVFFPAANRRGFEQALTRSSTDHDRPSFHPFFQRQGPRPSDFGCVFKRQRCFEVSWGNGKRRPSGDVYRRHLPLGASETTICRTKTEVLYLVPCHVWKRVGIDHGEVSRY